MFLSEASEEEIVLLETYAADTLGSITDEDASVATALFGEVSADACVVD